jgi:hypothetical protein
MKRYLWLAVIVLLAAACSGGDLGGMGVAGSGKQVTRQFDLSGFTRVDASHGFQLKGTRGDDYNVAVQVDDNVEPYLQVRTEGDTLYIGLEQGRAYLSTTLRAQVTLPELTGLELSGGSAGEVTGLTTDKAMDFGLSGGSRLTGDVTGGDARLDLSGGSRMEVTGRAGDVSIDASGGSRALLGGWPVQDARVNASGGSQIEIDVSGRLSGDASGGSRVNYSGSPTSVDVTTSGGSSVQKK